MPLIDIREVDNTRPTGAAENTDVVYVPGFVDLRITGNDRIEVNKPTLFTSVSEFETKCGTRAVVFERDQYYSELNTIMPDGSVSGFAPNAVPFHDVMFHAGDQDPGYVMAKELLMAGLPVLFERMNSDENYSATFVVNAKPDNFDAEPYNYQHTVQAANKITTTTIPTFGFRNANGTVYKSENEDYYTLSTDTAKTGATPRNWIFTKVEDKSEIPVQDGKILSDAYYTYDPILNLAYVKLEGPFTASPNDETNTVVAPSGSYRKVTDTKYVLITSPNTYVGDYYTASSISDNYLRGNGPFSISISNDNEKETGTYFGNWYTDYSKYYYVTSDDTWETYEIGEEFITDDQVKNREILSSTDIKTMYDSLSVAYLKDEKTGLVDKGNYSIKYLTSGGYPVYEYKGGSIMTRMLSLAEARGDCIAIIDHTDNIERNPNIDQDDSLYRTLINDESLNGDYTTFGTMFTPWAMYNRVSVDKDNKDDHRPSEYYKEQIRMPASFGYLKALADSIKTYANWLAIAGATRGIIPNLATGGMTTIIPNAVADDMIKDNAISINPITEIKPYGNVIWGNRTLARNSEGVKALSYLNIRNLVSDVKKLVYRTCRRLTYEPNTDQLWVNIQAAISPTLDKMKSGYGISGYQLAINRESPHYGEKATFCFKIILYPVYAVEAFYIDVILEDDEVIIE